MTDLDKRLEKLLAIKGGREYVLTRVLIAALLRARKALRGEYGTARHLELIESALNDTELEEAIP